MLCALTCLALVAQSNRLHSQFLGEWQGLKFYAYGKDTIEYPYDGTNPVGHLMVVNEATTNSPAQVTVKATCSLAAGGLLNVFPNGGKLAILLPGDTSFVNNWFQELLDRPTLPFSDGEYRTARVDYHFDNGLSSTAVSRNYTIYYAGKNPIPSGNTQLLGKIVVPAYAAGRSCRLNLSTMNWKGINIPLTYSAPDTGYLFSTSLHDRNTWYLTLSGQVRSATIEMDHTRATSVRIEADTTMENFISTYDTVSNVVTTTGFWRGAFSASEQTVAFFPGQENWQAGRDSMLKSTAKIYKYTLGGQLLWEHVPGWETWGGDMSPDGRFVAYALYTGKFGNSASNDQLRLVLLDGATGQVIWSLRDSLDFESYEIAFSHQADLIAVGTTGQGKVSLFDRATGMRIWKTPTIAMADGANGFGQIRKILFDAQDDYLYVGSGDNYLRKIRVSDGAVIWRTCVGGWPFVNGLQLAPGGDLIAVGMKSAMVACVRTSDGVILWSRDTGNFDDAYFSPDGKYIADFTGKVFEAASGKLVGKGGSNSVGQFTSDGKYVCRMGKGNMEFFSVQASSLAYASPSGNMNNGPGEQPQWMFLSPEDSLGVVAARDMGNPPQTGLTFFRRTRGPLSNTVRPLGRQAVILECHPNPFLQYCNLWSSEELSNATIMLENVFGQQVAKYTRLDGHGFTLMRENWPDGLYILRLFRGNSLLASRKLVILN